LKGERPADLVAKGRQKEVLAIIARLQNSAFWFGFDGVFVPSARSQGRNLVIYPGRANESFTVTDQKVL